MKILVKDAFDALDTDMKNLYKEKDGAYHFDGVPRSVNNGTLEAKRAAEAEIAALKAKYGDLDPDAAKKAIDAQRAADQKRAVDAGEFDKVLGQTRAEAQAAADKLKADYEAQLATERTALGKHIRDGELTRAAIDAGVHKDAIEDVLLYGASAMKVENGKLVSTEDGKTEVSPAKWLKEMLGKKKHWLGVSTGGGTSKGGDGVASGKGRAQMSEADKLAYIKANGHQAYLKLPK
jgi:hypothetical protein